MQKIEHLTCFMLSQVLLRLTWLSPLPSRGFEFGVEAVFDGGGIAEGAHLLVLQSLQLNCQL